MLQNLWRFIVLPFRLGMSINRFLLRRFDQSRVAFALFWWPLYLVAMLICLLGLLRFLDWSADTAWELAAIGIICGAAVPMYLSFFPACVIFFACYLELFAWMRLPTANWALRRLQPSLDWLREHIENRSNR